MILECGNCAKMYRIRDDASPQPQKCPTCGGDLKTAGGAAQNAPPGRVRELETKVQALERELAEARGGRPTLSVETSPGISGFSAPVAELRAAAEKADRLERDLLTLRSESERKLKEKEQEIAQLRESAEREAAERRKQEARGSGLEETHARALEGKEKTIQALDASIASYRSQLEALQKKFDAVEIQRLNDLNSFDSRLREREQADRSALDRATGNQQKALADLRAEMEERIAEKDRLITEGRQALDREAGERRRLSETLNRLQENAGREVAEKQAALSAVEATLSSYKSKIETLQGRVDCLEQMRRSEHDQFAKKLRTSQAIRSRVDEASHLAIDLDHSLDSIEASIATLRDRARRLKGTLEETSQAQVEVPPLAPASTDFAEGPAPEAETQAAPALSQTGGWGGAAPAPAPVEEAEPAVEEAPALSEVEEAPAEAEPALDEVPAAEPELLEAPPVMEKPEAKGRVQEPSGVFPAADGAADDIPLISGPEEEPPVEKAPPPPPKKEETKRKFSWQRK